MEERGLDSLILTSNCGIDTHHFCSQVIGQNQSHGLFSPQGAKENNSTIGLEGEDRKYLGNSIDDPLPCLLREIVSWPL